MGRARRLDQVAAWRVLVVPGVQSGQRVLDVAQARAHAHQELARQLGLVADPVEERLALGQLGLDRRGGAHRGAARSPLEHAHLADELARAHRAEHDRLVADLAQDIDAARENLDRHVARIALPEQGLARLEPPAHAAAPPRVSDQPCRRNNTTHARGRACAAGDTPLARSALLVSREKDLEMLAKSAQGRPDSGRSGRWATVTGLGGIGKTRLASEFVHRYR